ncbi:hypothetical protein HYU17_04525 [Candidatus Woesearchaeota archaeon]|nr:hypothetical protein [Candidatus Woesearchaeota archaeon]
MMIVKLKAPGIVAMILFIPLIMALGLILAFIVPLLALVTALSATLFLGMFILAKIGCVKQRVEIGSSDEKQPSKLQKKRTVEVKDYT